jgi:hypothetical protein
MSRALSGQQPYFGENSNLRMAQSRRIGLRYCQTIAALAPAPQNGDPGEQHEQQYGKPEHGGGDGHELGR